MNYIKKDNGQYPVKAIHIKNRGHSFDEYAIVYNSKIPAYDPEIQGCREVKPVEIDGRYYKQYEIYELSESGVEAYKIKFNSGNKDAVRREIRKLKDIEDDLVDQKIITQNILYLLSDIWINVLTVEQKINSKYKAMMDIMAPKLLSSETVLRADLESPERLMSILEDEKTYASIVKEQYLDKIK